MGKPLKIECIGDTRSPATSSFPLCGMHAGQTNRPTYKQIDRQAERERERQTSVFSTQGIAIQHRHWQQSSGHFYFILLREIVIKRKSSGRRKCPTHVIYTVFHEESESEVKNLQIPHPDLKIEENHPGKI